MEIKSSEFFKNMKSLPPVGHPDFYSLIDWEKEKLLGGVTIGGVYISGWLYWHLNHWWIGIDEEDKFGNSVMVPSLPELRDNEWERAEAIEMCKNEKKGYIEIGQRRGGKSETLCSYLVYNATLFENTQNAIIAGNAGDIATLIQKIDFGLPRIWEGIRIDKIDKDWRKSMVRLGYKDQLDINHVWSNIAIRNAADGKNTEVVAGLTLKTFILDECGKFPFGQVISAAKPALLTKNGWRGIPMAMGTGGAFEKGEDAERYFNNPEANNFKGFKDTETSKECGKFFSGLYRMDYKVDSNLADYLINEKGMNFSTLQYRELSKIPMKVSNKEKALEKINEDRNKKKKDPNRVELLKEIMYFPLTPEECFMTEGVNIFNEVAAKQQQEFLLRSGKYQGDRVILRETQEGIQPDIITDESIAPVSTFPLQDNESKAGCIIIYEHPPKGKVPFGLYVGGVDPYKQDQAEHSDSLGAIYIFKRLHDISGERYQDMIVAQYVGRPESIDEWCENCRLLIKYYNALTFAENEDLYFIKYMQFRHEDHYLADEQPFIKALVPTSTVERGKGFHASPKIINFLNNNLKTYSEEVEIVERDEDGEITNQILGMSKILDIMLLEEMKKYRHGGNYDRIRAASAAITLARRLDPYYIPTDQENDSRVKSYRERLRDREKRNIGGALNRGSHRGLSSKTRL